MSSRKQSSEERVMDYFRTAPLEAAKAMHNAARSVLALRGPALEPQQAAKPKPKKYWSRRPKQQPAEPVAVNE